MPDSISDYPNDGTPFQPLGQEPEKQKEARQREKGEALRELPLIKKTVTHLKKRIKFMESVDSIQVGIDEDPALFQKMYHVQQLVKQALQEELTLLEDIIDTHAP